MQHSMIFLVEYYSFGIHWNAAEVFLQLDHSDHLNKLASVFRCRFEAKMIKSIINPIWSFRIFWSQCIREVLVEQTNSLIWCFNFHRQLKLSRFWSSHRWRMNDYFRGTTGQGIIGCISCGFSILIWSTRRWFPRCVPWRTWFVLLSAFIHWSPLIWQRFAMTCS